MLQQSINNPFQYLTPEQISASDALILFVDVFKDYYHVLNPGNTFINGPRGSGKSMMFRIMKPDCQMKKFKKKLHEIDFYGIYVPVKETSLDITDLKILEQKHGGNFLNEHYFVTYLAITIFKSLAEENYDNYEAEIDSVRNYYRLFIKLLKKAGSEFEYTDIDLFTQIKDIFQEISMICSEIQNDFVINYLAKLVCGNENLPYNGPLCLYINFLSPLIKGIKDFKFLPNKPIYLLIDDADELNMTQTKILNSWVSYRTTNEICFKITTQLKYSTFFTMKGSKIDTPHDYFELDLNSVYTSEQRERYYSNVRDIVEKRLKLISKIDVKAHEFFPENTAQKSKIEIIKNRLYDEKYKETGSKDKARDFAYRNARLDYMKSLSNKYSYSYSGFEQLVHLSSGIIRNFLDLASRMYTTAVNKNPKSKSVDIREIPVGIQNEEIKTYSDWLLSSEFDKLLDDKELQTNKQIQTTHKRLRNLIEALGKAFRIILLSNSSERRKFAFYFDSEINQDVKDVIKLGLVYGYFHKSTLGAKDGLGRAKLYVLNRMLAPYYKLDPFSFSGYLYLTPAMLDLAINSPNAFIKRIEKKDYDYDAEVITEQEQLQINFNDK